MKNKHADLIHAWADGAIIQYKDYAGKWNDFEPITHASWHDNMEYRIKPESSYALELNDEQIIKITNIFKKMVDDEFEKKLKKWNKQ